jgi:hypothetical protein
MKVDNEDNTYSESMLLSELLLKSGFESLLATSNKLRIIVCLLGSNLEVPKIHYGP